MCLKYLVITNCNLHYNHNINSSSTSYVVRRYEYTTLMYFIYLLLIYNNHNFYRRERPSGLQRRFWRVTSPVSISTMAFLCAGNWPVVRGCHPPTGHAKTYGCPIWDFYAKSVFDKFNFKFWLTLKWP